MNKYNPRKGWNSDEMISYYSSKRHSINHLYPSEKYFLTRKFLRPLTSVLDVGCAMGGFSSIFKQLQPKIKYTGIDIIEDFIQVAKKEHVKEGSFKLYSGKGPFPVDNHSLVFSSGILHLCKNWKQLFKQMIQKANEYVLCDFRTIVGDSYDGTFHLGYNAKKNISYHTIYKVLNINELLNFLKRFREIEKIEMYGYEHAPSQKSKNVGKVWMVFCKCWINKNDRKELKEIIIPEELVSL